MILRSMATGRFCRLADLSTLSAVTTHQPPPRAPSPRSILSHRPARPPASKPGDLQAAAGPGSTVGSHASRAPPAQSDAILPLLVSPRSSPRRAPPPAASARTGSSTQAKHAAAAKPPMPPQPPRPRPSRVGDPVRFPTAASKTPLPTAFSDQAAASSPARRARPPHSTDSATATGSGSPVGSSQAAWALGLVCDQAQASSAAVLTYTGIGLSSGADPLVPVGSSAVLVVTPGADPSLCRMNQFTPGEWLSTL